MFSSFSVKEFWQRFKKTSKSYRVNIVAQRYIQACIDHGVQPSQIPTIFSQIKLDSLTSEKSLLAALTPEVLDQTAKFFGIRKAWLEGVDDHIYECLLCYKQPITFWLVRGICG